MQCTKHSYCMYSDMKQPCILQSVHSKTFRPSTNNFIRMRECEMLKVTKCA